MEKSWKTARMMCKFYRGTTKSFWDIGEKHFITFGLWGGLTTKRVVGAKNYGHHWKAHEKLGLGPIFQSSTIIIKGVRSFAHFRGGGRVWGGPSVSIGTEPTWK